MTPPRHAAALCLLLLGLGQLVRVHTGGLTRWRGGGMGMYSEFHPNETVVVAVRDGQQAPVEAWRCQRLPTPACLAEALGDHPTAEALVAYRPRYTPASRTFDWVEVARASR